MAFTLAQLQALEDAIAQGALRVRYSDKEVQYRSLDEMLQLQSTMQAQLGTQPRANKRLLAKHSKGL